MSNYVDIESIGQFSKRNNEFQLQQGVQIQQIAQHIVALRERCDDEDGDEYDELSS